MPELKDYFSDAVNASGKAIVAITCLCLTLVIAAIEAVAACIRWLRTWIETGCKIKYPRWIIPGGHHVR